VSYVLAGLDQDYNSFLENIAGKTEISLDALYSQLLVGKDGVAEFWISAVPIFREVHDRNGYHGYGGGGRGGFDRGFGGRGEHGSSDHPNRSASFVKRLATP
jgi:hypothetical protein